MAANLIARACPEAKTVPEGRRLVGVSPQLQSIRDIAASVATRRSSILLLGETGTGKEMVARHIHDSSSRRESAFIPVDCSALPENLIESQLFGHRRGAFTGALRDSLGFIRAAEGGTLFIDEIGELPLSAQAKLLRVLQERAVVPLGDTTPIPVDVRVICATHRDLKAMVEAGTFREDLYFRLNVISLTLPPLRERTGDVLPLADHFLRLQADLYGEDVRTLDDSAKVVLAGYAWPGNVRELANVMEHAHVLAAEQCITAADLPERLSSGKDAAGSVSELCLADIERRTIVEALRRSKQNKTAACKLLGINIQRLNRRIEKLRIK